jgi:hypothetical protein
MLKFKWADNCRIKADPEKAYQAIEKIRGEKGGAFKPEHLWKAAKGKRHVLHNEFEWNNEIAGAKYRTIQAAKVIRSLKMVRSLENEGEVRTVCVSAFTSMGSGAEDGRQSKYYDTTEILSDGARRSLLLKKVWGQLLSLKVKYSDLHEFSKVWSAINDVESDLAG